MPNVFLSTANYDRYTKLHSTTLTIPQTVSLKKSIKKVHKTTPNYKKPTKLWETLPDRIKYTNYTK